MESLTPLHFWPSPRADEQVLTAREEGLKGRVTGMCSCKPRLGEPGHGECKRGYGQDSDNLCFRTYALRMTEEKMRNLPS